MYRSLKDDLLDRCDRIHLCTMVQGMTKYDFDTKFGILNLQNLMNYIINYIINI